MKLDAIKRYFIRIATDEKSYIIDITQTLPHGRTK